MRYNSLIMICDISFIFHAGSVIEIDKVTYELLVITLMNVTSSKIQVNLTSL
jgi:hypothetical protein